MLVPYGWFNLGYWLYDLLALSHLANYDKTVEGEKDSNCNDMLDQYDEKKDGEQDCFKAPKHQSKLGLF